MYVTIFTFDNLCTTASTNPVIQAMHMAAGESSVLPVMRIYFNISVIIGVKSISVLIFRALLACQIDSHTEAKSWRETSVSEQRTAANENIAL